MTKLDMQSGLTTGTIFINKVFHLLYPLPFPSGKRSFHGSVKSLGKRKFFERGRRPLFKLILPVFSVVYLNNVINKNYS